jgi:hypothetical protein
VPNLSNPIITIVLAAGVSAGVTSLVKAVGSERKSSEREASAAPVTPPPPNDRSRPEIVAVPVAEARALSSANAPLAREPGSEEPSPAEAPEPLSAHIEDYRPFLQSVFESEPVDLGWSRTSEATLREELGTFVGSNLVREVSCRSSLCRVELATPDLETYAKASQDITMSGKWPGPAVLSAKDEAKGDYAMVAYFGKQGQPLPDG